MNQATNASRILVESGTNELEVMSFVLEWQGGGIDRISTAVFGINAAKVKELLAVPECVSQLPAQPPFVEGIFLLRNRVIPLISLCKWFGFIPNDAKPNSKRVAVVVELYSRDFAFVVNSVDKVYRISWKDIEPPPPFLVNKTSAIVSNARVGDRIIQMIDFEDIISHLDPAILDGAGVRFSMEQTPETSGNSAQDTDSCPPGTILIADDSPTLRARLVKTVLRGGYKVLQAVDGQHAWDILMDIKDTSAEGRAEDQLQAVVTDIEMPRMDGYHLCRKIKADSAFARIPVILFSSLAGPSLRNKGIAVGADDQVSKPDLPGLVETIGQTVARLRSPAGTQSGKVQNSS